MSEEVTDLIVRTADPKRLDETVQQLPACTAVVVDGTFDGETCRLRVFEGLGFLKFALANQGYGDVVSEEPLR